MISDHSMKRIDVYSGKIAEVLAIDMFRVKTSNTNYYGIILSRGIRIAVKFKKVMTDNPRSKHFIKNGENTAEDYGYTVFADCHCIRQISKTN